MKNKMERKPNVIIGQINNPNPIDIRSIHVWNRTSSLSTEKVFF